MKSRDEIPPSAGIDNGGNFFDDEDSDVSYEASETDSDSDFELQEGKHFKQEMTWESSFAGTAGT